MKDFIKVTKALSDTNRIKIIKLLQQRAMYVNEIHEALCLAQSTVSKHLQILQEAGLVVSSREGLWVSYRLADGSTNPYAASLLGTVRYWLEDDSSIQELMKRLPGIRCNKSSQPASPRHFTISTNDEPDIYR